jgi:hypothetical protein
VTLLRTGRRILTGALLGLPAALFAHTLIFKGGHEAGGSIHGLLFGLASGFGFIAALAVALVAIRRVRGATPRFLPILCGAIAWFGAIEAFEADRSIPIALALFALVACSWLVRAVLRAFAHTVVAVVCTLWSAIAKVPQLCSNAIELAAPALHHPASRFRIFSRPPPLHS